MLSKDRITKEISWKHFPLILAIGGMFFSTALISIAIGLMTIVALFNYQAIRHSEFIHKAIWFILCIYALYPVTGFLRGDEHWLSEVILKAPLLIVPAYLLSIRFHFKKDELLSALLAIVVVLVAVVSTVNYFTNKAEIDALLLQSKHVPVFGGIHHIYFGVYLSSVVWLSLYLRRQGSLGKYWSLLAIIGFVCMHVLVSRTGLVAFYASGIVVFLHILQNRSQRVKRWAILLIVLLPVLAIMASTSMRNKITNSVEDFHAVVSGEDINFKSLAMRVEAWKATYHLWSEHPIIGVGDQSFERELQDAYEKIGTSLYPENRIGPHNQILEASAKYGIIGGVTILSFMLMWLIAGKRSALSMTYFVLFGLVLLLESWLERQLGMVGIGLFVFGSMDVSKPFD